MTTTVTTYAVLPVNDPIEWAAVWHPYEDQREAERVRKNLDTNLPDKVPYRIVEVRCELAEVAKEKKA